MFYVEIRLPADELMRRVILDDTSNMAWGMGAVRMRLLEQVVPNALEFDFDSYAVGMQFVAAVKNDFPYQPIMVFTQ